MTPAAAKASYARLIKAHGERITLQRGDDIHPGLWARVAGAKPEELVGDMDQAERKIILLAEGVPIEPKKSDILIVRGKPLSIETIDDSTRRVAGVLIAYEIMASG